MSECPLVYVDGEELDVFEALEIVNEEFVDDGKMCGQTIVDLIECLRYYIDKDKTKISIPINELDIVGNSIDPYVVYGVSKN